MRLRRHQLDEWTIDLVTVYKQTMQDSVIRSGVTWAVLTRGFEAFPPLLFKVAEHPLEPVKYFFRE